jgi:hypothetical protein
VGRRSAQLFAQVLENSRGLSQGLGMNLGRDADAAGLRERLEARRDVDAVAIDITALADDIAKIDADAEQDASVFREARICIGKLALQFDSSLDRVHRAREFDQDTVAHNLHDAAPMRFDCRLENRSRRSRNALSVAASSDSMRREYPTTSATKIAARRR